MPSSIIASLTKHDRSWDTVARDVLALRPDAMTVAEVDYLHLTATQLHPQARYHGGQDERQKPYSLFRVRVDAQPVLLR